MFDSELYAQLEFINRKPTLYEKFTSDLLWTDPYTSMKMLELHTDPEQELASRKESFIEASVAWIAKEFELGSGSRVCDFGCGPGLYTQRFAQLGAQVTGIDFSQRSIDYAREQAIAAQLDINYVHQDYLSYSSSERFDLITMIYCDFCALTDEGRRTILQKFAQLLSGDGALVLDVFTTRRFDAVQEEMSYTQSSTDSVMSSFWSADPYYVFSNTFRYEAERIFLTKYTIVEAQATREVFNWLKCFDLEELKALFRDCGLQITATYRDVAGRAYETGSDVMAVVAKKA